MLDDPTGLEQVDEVPEEQQRVGLGASFNPFGDHFDIGDGLGGLANMFIPQSIGTRGAGLDSFVSDLVEFSPGYGDAKDLVTGIRGEEGGYQLDPLERGLAIFAGVGVFSGVAYGAAKAKQALHKDIARQRQSEIQARLRQASLSSIPAPGTPLTADPEIRATPETAEGAAARRNLAAEAQEQRTRRMHPRHWDIYQGATWGELAVAIRERTNQLAPADWELEAFGAYLVDRYAQEGIEFEADRFEGDTPALVAAQRAVVKFLNASDAGMLKWRSVGESHLTSDWDFWTAFNSAEPARQGEAMDYLAEFDVITTKFGIGPDLAPTPQSTLSHVYQDRDGRVRGVIGLHTELLPNERTIDRKTKTQLPGGNARLEARLRNADFQTMVGDFATNLVFTALREAQLNPQRFERSVRWYPNFNASATKLAEVTGFSLEQATATISLLSPQTKWLPDNLVTATHVMLNAAGLDSASPEYRQAFRDVIEAGGWTNELLHGSSKKVQRRFTSARQMQLSEDGYSDIVDYWADPANSTVNEGKNLRGAEIDVKKRYLSYILQADVPWHFVLRMAKTHNFAILGMNPYLDMLTVIDTHSNNATTGTVYGGEPLGSKGVRTARQAEAMEGINLSSGQSLDMADIHNAVAAIQESRDRGDTITVAGVEINLQGMTDKDIENLFRSARQVPNDTATSRYEAQQIAHTVAIDLLGELMPDIKWPNQLQAATWVPTQELKANLRKKLYAAKQAGEVLEIRDNAVVDWSVIDHMEGNPAMMKGVAGMTANVNDDLNLDVDIPTDVQPTGKTADSPGQAIFVEPTVSGDVVVVASVETPGVRSVLRHLYPSNIQDVPTGYRRMLRRKPTYMAKIGDFDRTTSTLESGAEVRRFGGNPNDYVGFKPGNHIVIETAPENISKIEAVLAKQPRAFGVTVNRSQATGKRAGTQRLTNDQVQRLGTRWLHDPRTWQENDFVMVSAFKEGMSEAEAADAWVVLGEELARRGYHPVPVDGIYQGQREASWLAFGASHSEAVEIGRKFNQESVWTRSGLLYPNYRGNGGAQLDPNVGVNTDLQAAMGEYSSEIRLPDGRVARVAGEIDFDARQSFTPDQLAELDLEQAPARASARIEVDLGGLENGLPWDMVDDVWNDIDATGLAQNMSAYTAGDLWAPNGAVRATEHVFADPTGEIRTVRHNQDVRTADSNQVDLWVRERDSVGLPDANMEQLSSRRSFKDVRDVLEINGDTITVGGQVAIVADGDVQLTRTGSLLSGKVDGKSIRNVQVNLQGPFPVIRLAAEVGDPSPGMAVVSVSRGRVRRIKAWDVNDLHGAAKALEGIGQTIDPSVAMDAQAPELNVAPVYDPSGEVGSFEESAYGRIAVREGNFDAVIRGEEISPEMRGRPGLEIRLGDNISGKQAAEIHATMRGFFGVEDARTHPELTKFVEEYGPLDFSLFSWTVPQGVTVAKLRGQAQTHGWTFPSHVNVSQNGVFLNETAIVADQRMESRYVQQMRSFQPDWFVQSNLNRTDLNFTQQTLVHEVAHVVHRMADGNTGAATTRAIAEAWHDLGPAGRRRHVSRYGGRNQHEFFAEAVVRVMYDPNPHPVLTKLVRTVWQYANVRR